MLSWIKTIKSWFGYEEVAVVKAKRDGGFYSPTTEVTVVRENRKYYTVSIKDVFWNVKNYIKYKLRMEYVKDRDGKVRIKNVHRRKQYVPKKDDFAIIRKSMVKYVVENPIRHFGQTGKSE